MFVNLQSVKSKVDGLTHISAIRQDRVNHPGDLLSRGQLVKVKVVRIQGTRIGLSMKDVDQNTGRDLDPAKRITSGANMERLDGTGSKYSSLDSNIVPVLDADSKFKVKKQMSSPSAGRLSSSSPQAQFRPPITQISTRSTTRPSPAKASSKRRNMLILRFVGRSHRSWPARRDRAWNFLLFVSSKLPMDHSTGQLWEVQH